jgi:hypothetical protein
MKRNNQMEEALDNKNATPESEALDSISRAIDRLGTADAATPMGAIEVLAFKLEEASSKRDAIELHLR